MSDKVFNVLEEKIEKTIARLHDELATVRAGRANAARDFTFPPFIVIEGPSQ